MAEAAEEQIATRIDGTKFAEGLRERVARQVEILKQDHNITPGLAVILVGDDPASDIYVTSKGKMSKEAGMNSFTHRLPADTPEAEVIELVGKLNADPSVNGVLCQLPMPDQIDDDKVVQSVLPAKDVDGLTLTNAGLLLTGGEAMVGCTPLGCLMLLKEYVGDMTGKKALVLGRSNLFGKPMAQLLIRENCTVTTAHSRTRDLAGECRQADILVVAIGQPRMVKSSWIKPGAVVIDVGINRIPSKKNPGKTRVVGDVNTPMARKVASAITPVPGGVGPMTIACLLQNTVTAACRQAGIEVPEV